MLLSLKVSKDLGYIRQEYPRIIQPIIKTVESRTLCLEEAATQSQIEVIKQQLMKEYADVFSCEDHLSTMTGPPMHFCKNMTITGGLYNVDQDLLRKQKVAMLQ